MKLVSTKSKSSQKNKSEFSKKLIWQESMLIWVVTLALIGLAYLCIIKGYTGTLPWLTSMVALPWTAYAVSQSFFYNKAQKENTQGGIKYETALAEIAQKIQTEAEGIADELNKPDIWGPI